MKTAAPRRDGGVIVLAAGRARRFGSDKRRHVLPDGTALLAQSVARYASAFPHCIVVLRPDDPDPAELLARPPLAQGDGPRAPQVVRAANADLGMGHSLAAGAAAATGWGYAFVALGDMPWVEPATLATLRTSLEQALAEGATDAIVQPLCSGTPGHPVGFARAWLDELRGLQGDEGARSVLRRHPDCVRRVEVGDPGVLRDLDTPDQH